MSDNLLLATLSQVAAGTDASHPVGGVILFMVLASIFEPQLLLSRIAILLCDGASLHLLARLQGFLLQLNLIFSDLLLVFLLLILDQLLEHMRLL